MYTWLNLSLPLFLTFLFLLRETKARKGLEEYMPNLRTSSHLYAYITHLSVDT